MNYSYNSHLYLLGPRRVFQSRQISIPLKTCVFKAVLLLSSGGEPRNYFGWGDVTEGFGGTVYPLTKGGSGGHAPEKLCKSGA